MFVGEKVHIVQILSIIFLCANGPPSLQGGGGEGLSLKLKQIVSAQQSLVLGGKLCRDDGSQGKTLT